LSDPRFWTIDETLARAMSAFRAKRGERTIYTAAGRSTVRTPGERVLYLPNGRHVKVSVDDSGTATQVEDAENLHAIVRPGAITVPIRTPRRSRK
jgi:Arc/MetJ family transcription regulator